MTTPDTNDVEDIKDIRIYTTDRGDLTLDQITYKINSDNGKSFYSVTPSQFACNAYSFFINTDPSEGTLSYLVTHTNVDTVDFFIQRMIPLGWYGDNDPSLLEYIGDALASVDCNMYKYILDKCDFHKKDIVGDLIMVVQQISDDQFIDGFINVCNWIGVSKNITYSENFMHSSFIYFILTCAFGSNYKILKYFLNLCKDNNCAVDMTPSLLPLIFGHKREFIDLVLSFSDSDTRTISMMYKGDYLWVDINLKGLRLLHQLYIEERIDISLNILQSLLVHYFEEKYKPSIVYLITAFPILCMEMTINSINTLFHEICDEIRFEHKELIAEIDC